MKIILIYFVCFQDAEDEEEEKSDGLRPSPDAETAVLFPEYPDKRMTFFI